MCRFDSSPILRQNFHTACRVFFDNAASAMREVCEREQTDCGLPIPTTNLLQGTEGLRLSEIEFSALAKHLCDGKHRVENHSGSFFEYLFEAEWIAATDGESSFLKVLPQQGRNAVDVASFDWSQLDKQKVYTPSQVSSMEQDSNNCNLFRLNRPRNKKYRTVHVYLTTPQWAAIYKLKEERNKYVGHNCSAALHTSDLTTLFDDVKKCYRVLNFNEDTCSYKQLEKIERGINNQVYLYCLQLILHNM